MNRNTRKEIEELARIFADLDDPQLIKDFLVCMLTPKEIDEIARRWSLVKMLDRGDSQREIARKLGMSLCKITRGSKELKKRGSAFKRVLERYIYSQSKTETETQNK
jgi:TrpR family trp operon transcriptional repressor